MTDWFVGFDPSYSSFGLGAVDAESEVFSSRAVKLPKAKYGDGGRRLMFLREELRGFLESILEPGDRLRRIAIEGYAYGSRNGREQAGEVGGIARMIAFQHVHMEPLIVAPTTLKRWATGKGSADKALMAEKAFERWEFRVPSHDEVDALCLAQYARLEGEPDGSR